ncbi:HD-GYP domain-containing protein [Xylanivirga thermophila]|uniref:HD-GYP domain-containing protein n=1 Tax=Xylanivirga thermophila TaxID=2496273 RepID=UPI0013ED5367|nr:HD domain-containing phosphohydrolase [Xylanivirga thermophila]
MYPAYIDEFRKQDRDLQLHGLRVAQLGYQFSFYLGMDDASLDVQMAGLLHDIGKIYVPKRILQKPSKLTQVEYYIVAKHSIDSYMILKDKEYPKNICDIVKYHHENWDGSGYPDGLVREEIPFGARILKILDVFDALTTNRPYRKAMSADEALRLMNEESKNFDCKLLDSFLLWIKEKDNISTKLVGDI